MEANQSGDYAVTSGQRPFETGEPEARQLLVEAVTNRPKGVSGRQALRTLFDEKPEMKDMSLKTLSIKTRQKFDENQTRAC